MVQRYEPELYEIASDGKTVLRTNIIDDLEQINDVKQLMRIAMSINYMMLNELKKLNLHLSNMTEIQIDDSDCC